MMHSVLLPFRRIIMRAVPCLLFVVGAAAQTPSPEQLEIFRNLTPEQQRAILEQMGQGGVSAGVGGDANSSAANRVAAVREEALRRVPSVAPALEEVPRLEAGDTVLVSTVEDESEDEEDKSRAMPVITQQEAESRQRLTELILSRNPFQLDGEGQLHLPGVAPIPLRGLTEEQATRRLAFDPALQGIRLQLERLPVLRPGVQGLKPFGYDLFENAPSTFSPLTDVPVPSDYIIGAGDEFSVQLFGNQNRSMRLVVSRDGTVNFPELGPIRVAGLTFNGAREVIETRVAQQMIGVQVSVTMGDMRAIRVFVLGEARIPGSYSVSGLATMTTALFASGGVKTIGSLRDIQLKRQDQVVARLDLYDLLLRGNTSGDARLQQGDVIFIPPVGPTVAVEGEVKRPAIYELKGEMSAEDLLQMAGGLTPDADPTRASLTRVDEQLRRVVLNVDFSQSAGRTTRLRNGDSLRVARLRPQLDAGVMLEGFVHRPGPIAWREGLRLTDVLGSVDELKPNADASYVLIRRESGPDRRVDALSADLVAALAAPGSAADPLLQPRDRITVFELAPGRERIIGPLLEEIRLQSGPARPTGVVRITGEMKAPGEYPLEPGMRISDLIRAGGGLLPSAYVRSAEVTRYEVSSDETRRTELIEVDLAAALAGDRNADILLQPFDHLLIRQTPDWNEQYTVTLRGEVRFPGTYPIRRGETLRQLLERAGGLTEEAFPEGGVFMREDLRQLEQEQLDRLAERMRSDLTPLALQAANTGQGNAAQALAAGESLLSQLTSVRAVGRSVIDLPGLLAGPPRGEKDVVLRGGDTLMVPKRRQEVTVIGEVQNATTHLYKPELDRDDYIERSGGVTRKADKRRIYVVRADGSVVSQGGSRFSRQYAVAMKPGDTIVVPVNTERMPRLPFWQAVTEILYNVAVSVAAVNSF